MAIAALTVKAHGQTTPIQSRPTTIPERVTSPTSPPGSASIAHFTSTCIACHLCVSACPSRVLVPAIAAFGVSSIMQPRMNFRSGYCNYECTFCMVYKKGPRFSVRSVAEISRDIDESFERNGATVRSIFFPAGNTIVMATKDLAAICRYSVMKFPGLRRMTVYGSSQYIAQKGFTEMRLLREAGLSRIHVGLESGDDTILNNVKKGTTAAEQIQVGRIVKEAGMQLSEYVILGLGGAERSIPHALKTAEALNAIEPDFVRLRTLVPKINTLLLHQINKGQFQLLSPHQVLRETRLLIENLAISTSLTSDHYTNYLNLSGRLPEKKNGCSRR